MSMGYEAFLSSMAGSFKMGDHGVYGRTSDSFDTTPYNRSFLETLFPLLCLLVLIYLVDLFCLSP
jgi:hypothetical protein